MKSLRQSLVDYLAVRRSLGYKLKAAGSFLDDYVSYLEKLNVEQISTKHALDWVRLRSASVHQSAMRLSAVRVFASYMHAIDPAHEVPPSDLLPRPRCRATPYLYSDEQIVALLQATDVLLPSHRAATHRALIGLLSVTGMRIGEAITLDRKDIDWQAGVLTIRKTKFRKSRELPLHPSTIKAIRGYLRRRDRPRTPISKTAVFVSSKGTRLRGSCLCVTFHQLLRRVGIKPRSDSCRPRLHDFRHTLAVRTLIDAYRDEGDAGARLALLSTYLGHIDPATTYWYLSASPELLALAGERLDRHTGGQP